MGLQLTLCALATRLGAWAWRTSCLKEHEKKKNQRFQSTRSQSTSGATLGFWIWPYQKIEGWLSLSTPQSASGSSRRGEEHPGSEKKSTKSNQPNQPKISRKITDTLPCWSKGDQGRGIHGVSVPGGRSSSRSALGFQHVDAAASSSSVTYFWAVFHIFINLCWWLRPSGFSGDRGASPRLGQGYGSIRRVLLST